MKVGDSGQKIWRTTKRVRDKEMPHGWTPVSVVRVSEPATVHAKKNRCRCRVCLRVGKMIRSKQTVSHVY